ncbi:MAG: hypothetical protein HYV65_03280 [Candidatus Spechtbacteria bacterium]|nr:hypothetical protein [Candidatus Spechtbacteria bacterium]
MLGKPFLKWMQYVRVPSRKGENHVMRLISREECIIFEDCIPLNDYTLKLITLWSNEGDIV